MREEGTLSIVGDAHGYHVRYASNDYHRRERLSSTCPDEAALAAFLHACGLDEWAIERTCAELREGRVAVMPIACASTQLETCFPSVRPRDALLRAHAPWVATRQALHALVAPQEQR